MLKHGAGTVAALLAFVALQAAPAQKTANVVDLGWLGGAWVSETASGWTEEHWSSPRGGLMLGTNRSGKDELATGFEYMRISAGKDGKVSFWASPGGSPAVEFPLVSAKAGEAVFENARHDYPTRIVYRRNGNKLVGAISGPGGKNPMSWTFKRR